MLFVKSVVLYSACFFLISNVVILQVQSKSDIQKADFTQPSEHLNMNNVTDIAEAKKNNLNDSPAFKSVVKDIFTSSIHFYDKNRKKNKNYTKSIDSRSNEVNSKRRPRSVEHNQIKMARRRLNSRNNEILQKSIKSNTNSNSENAVICSHKNLRRCAGKSSGSHQRQKLKASNNKYSKKAERHSSALKSQKKSIKEPANSRNLLTNNHRSYVVMKKNLKSNREIQKINSAKSNYLSKKKYFDRGANVKSFSARGVKRHVLEENISKNVNVKMDNPPLSKNHVETKKNGGKHSWKNKGVFSKNNAMQNGAGKISASKTENAKTRKNISNKLDRHDRNESFKNIVQNENFNKNKSLSLPSKNILNMKNNESEASHKEKKALEFHVFNGKSKMLDERKKNHHKQHPERKYNNGKPKKVSNQFKKPEIKRKVGMHTNFRPKSHTVNETSVKIRRRRLLKGLNKSLRSDESSILYKIKDFIVNNFPKKKERREVIESNNRNVENGSNIKNESKKLLDEMKEFVETNFGSEAMKSSFSNLSHFNPDDFSIFQEEPKNDTRKNAVYRFKRDVETSPEFESENITIDEYDDATTENQLKREADSPSMNNVNELNIEEDTSELNTKEYNSTTEDTVDADTTNDIEMGGNDDFATEKSFTTFPSSVSNKRRAIFTTVSSEKSLDDDVLTENSDEESENAFSSELENSFKTDNTINFMTTSEHIPLVTVSTKNYRDVSESESFSSDFASVFPVSESSIETSNYDADLSTFPENYSSNISERSVLVSSMSSLNSMTHPESEDVSKLRDQNKREVSEDTQEVLNQVGYFEPESTLGDLSDDVKEQNYGSFSTTENDEVEATESKREQFLDESFKEKQNSFGNHMKNENSLKPYNKFSPPNKKISKPNRGEKVLLEKNDVTVRNEGVVDKDYEDNMESNSKIFSTTEGIDRQKKIPQKEFFPTKKHYNLKNDLLDSEDGNIKLPDSTDYSTEKYYDENQQQNTEQEYDDELSSVSDFLTSTASIVNDKPKKLKKLTKSNNIKPSYPANTAQVDINISNPVTVINHKITFKYSKRTNHGQTQYDNKNGFDDQVQERKEEYSYEDNTDLNDAENANSEETVTYANSKTQTPSTAIVQNEKNNFKPQSRETEDEEENALNSAKHSFDKHEMKNIEQTQDNLNFEDDMESAKTQSAIIDVNAGIKPKSHLFDDENYNTEDLETESHKRNDNAINNVKRTQSKMKQEHESDNDYEDASESSESEDGSEMDVSESDADNQMMQNNEHLNEKEANSEKSFKRNDDENRAEAVKYPDRIRKKEHDEDAEYDNQDKFSSDDDAESEINSSTPSTDKDVHDDDLPEFEKSDDKRTYYDHLSESKKRNHDGNHQNVRDEETDDFTEMNSIENEDEVSSSSKFTETSLDLQSVEKREPEINTSPMRYAATLRNSEKIPESTTEDREARNLNTDYEIGESTTWIDEDYHNKNTENEEYYDEIAKNDNTNQKSATFSKNSGKNTNEIFSKNRHLANVKQKKIRGERIRNGIGTVSVPDESESSTSPEKDITNVEDENVSELEHVTDISNSFHVMNDLKSKSVNKLKEYLDTVAHSRPKNFKKVHKSLYHIKTRKTRDVLSVQPTPLSETGYQNHLSKFVKPDKKWLIGIVGLLTISTMTVGMYHILPKRSKMKPKCSIKSSDGDFTRTALIDDRSDTELCDTNDEMKDRLSDDVKYIDNFIDDMLNRCESFEDEKLREEYSTSNHLSKIHLALNGIID